jgi:N-acetyl-1-D-myo-inositol-2-amino-2-deoxy-alpha-D-glucopyranoside deacetylase
LLRPAVVVTYEPGGGYGHPDHVQAHRVTARAVALAADPASASSGRPYAVPVVLWSAVDAAARARALDELAASPVAPDGLRLPADDHVPPSASLPADEVDLRVDLRPVLDRVVAALRAHATQVQAVQARRETGAAVALGSFALSDGVLQPLVRDEAYRLAAGRLAEVPWPDGVAWRDGAAR